MSDQPVIQWEYKGKPDPLMGTGATRAERSLVWLAGLVALAFYAVLYQMGRLEWHWWQYLVAGVIALDVGGGVVANSKIVYGHLVREEPYAPQVTVT